MNSVGIYRMGKLELQKLIQNQMSHELVRNLLKVPHDGKTIELRDGNSKIRVRVTTASHDTVFTRPASKLALE